MDQNSTQIEKDKKNNTIWWRGAVLFFVRVSGYMAGPIIIAVLLGKFLDNYFSTGRTFFFSLIALAFVSSLIFIVRESKKAIADIENENKVNLEIK
mgnify:CR=1 FL=1